MKRELFDYANAVLFTLAALLPIVNPLGSAPIFLSMTADLPATARQVSSPSNSSVVASGPEGPTLLVGASVAILAGATETFTVNFVLPAHGTMTVVPSARIPPVTWQVGGTTFQDDSPHTVSW